MSQEVKRQHYVPRTYLKNFSMEKADDFYISALPTNDPQTEKIFESTTKNVCLEQHLYTLPGNTVHERMLLESFYSTELEGHYTTIYNLLTDPAKVEITPRERELIITTVSTMFYRTTKWINQHNEFVKRTLTQLYELCQQTGKDYFICDGEKISIAGKNLKQIISENKLESKPMQVITQLESAFKLVAQRKAKDGIMVIKLLENECEFITSDNPVIISNVNGSRTMPFDPTNIMKLPIDNKHMLLLMPYGDESSINTIIRHNVSGTPCIVKTLSANSEQFSKAERFILGNQSSLNSYLEKKGSYERELTSEEATIAESIDEIIKKAKDSGFL